MSATATVTGLFVYPVKSMRGIALTRARLAATGFEHDRQWMVVNERGGFLTQRTHPKLARIVPQVDGNGLSLAAPGLTDLTVPADFPGEPIEVTVWTFTGTAITQGREADEWVSEALGEPVRLVRVSAGTGRQANPQFAPEHTPINFPDGYPILVVNSASLTDLNNRLHTALPVERFRPNVVISGLAPWAEDGIGSLGIGAVELTFVKACVRCSIPSLDHLTGDDSVNPLPTLRLFRFNKALKGVTFGENAVISRGGGGEIVLGSECQVRQRPVNTALNTN